MCGEIGRENMPFLEGNACVRHRGPLCVVKLGGKICPFLEENACIRHRGLLCAVKMGRKICPFSIKTMGLGINPEQLP